MNTPVRLAVLASGRGSNLQALLDAIATGNLDASVVGVFSDRPRCAALARVAPALRWSADPRDFADRPAFDLAIAAAVERVAPDWVLCAGYMRILGDGFVSRFRGRLLNVHPSLLPRHRGLNTHARVLQAGEAEHGASVHFVIPELDAGAVVAQARVNVLSGDDPQVLAERLLPVEHRLLLAVLQMASAGRLDEQDGKVLVDGQALFTPLRLDLAGNLAAGDISPR